MLKTLLDRISNITEPEFLFGSLLPVLIFVFAVAATLASVFGFEACINWAGNRTGPEQAIYPVVITIALIVGSYVLSALRPLVLKFWTTMPWLGPVRRQFMVATRRQYEAQRAEVEAVTEWRDLPEWFAEEAKKDWATQKQNVPANVLAKMIAEIGNLSAGAGVVEVKARVNSIFLAPLQQTYDGESLSAAYTAIWKKLVDWSDIDTYAVRSLRWKFDRAFGPPECLRPTRLGNIIEAYTVYPFVRYGIDPDVFWPHLQCRLTAVLQGPMTTAHTILDFALGTSTFAIFYSLLCIVGGPWLWNDAWFKWILLAGCGVVLARLTYEVAVGVAEQYGDLFRSAFDLHRFEVPLRRPVPLCHSDETELWEELSQLVVYGRTTNFVLTQAQSSVGVSQ